MEAADRGRSGGEIADQSSSSSAALAAAAAGSSAGATLRLFGRKRTVHERFGGGRVADIILWKDVRVTAAVVVGATVAWLTFERSGLPILTVSSDILLILIIVQFLHVKIAGLLKKEPRSLPELVLSEEMVNNAAAMFRLKVNNMLMMAHDITLGKDFKLFFQVVGMLWLVTVLTNFLSTFTIIYIGTILLVTAPAIYNKYEEHVDKYAGLVRQRFSKHYMVVDENMISLTPRRLSKEKET